MAGAAAKTYAASARGALGAVASAAQRVTIEGVATMCALWHVYRPRTLPGWLVCVVRARLLCVGARSTRVTSGAAARAAP